MFVVAFCFADFFFELVVLPVVLYFVEYFASFNIVVDSLPVPGFPVPGYASDFDFWCFTSAVCIIALSTFLTIK